MWRRSDTVGARGSSPHARGTQVLRAHRDSIPRFIPAYAGNAGQPVIQLQDAAVHPRIRGERNIVPIIPHRVIGSSPHTRGTRRFCQRGKCYRRFIPAYAGNALKRCCTGSIRTVHPRIRGERPKHPRCGFLRGGSSPHTRGTRKRHQWLARRTRFIPAYAGNAFNRRNENGVNRGSSPHTRGTLLLLINESFKSRFIPAYAGNAVGWRT